MPFDEDETIIIPTIIIPMEDDLVHTQEQRECHDPRCICHALEAEMVECEACGDRFNPVDGYYEPEEYAYCADCCHW